MTEFLPRSFARFSLAARRGAARRRALSAPGVWSYQTRPMISCGVEGRGESGRDGNERGHLAELSSQVRRERELEGMLCPAGVLAPWFGVRGPTLSIFPGDIKVALLQAIFAPITSLLLVVHAAVLDPQSPWNFTLTLKRHFQLTAGRPRPQLE